MESRMSPPWKKAKLGQKSHAHNDKYARDHSAVANISDATAVAASGLKSTASPLTSFREEPCRGLQRSSQSKGAETETCDHRAGTVEDSRHGHDEPDTTETEGTTRQTRRATKRPRTTDSTPSPPLSSRVVKVAAVVAPRTVATDDGAADAVSTADSCDMDHEHCDDDAEAVTDAVNPCPICLANEDDAGNHAMCFECGQMFCGSCNHSGKMPGCCPMCRSDNHPSPEVRAERLGRLLARSAGRHTRWAQCALGAMFFAGFGVAKDEVVAVQLLRLAADAGLVWAQHNLGNIYLNSDDSGLVRQNYAEAARFYGKAAAQGDRQSRFSLVRMYLTGKGFTNPNKEQAQPLGTDLQLLHSPRSPPRRGDA